MVETFDKKSQVWLSITGVKKLWQGWHDLGAQGWHDLGALGEQPFPKFLCTVGTSTTCLVCSGKISL